jgi:hypothetical protein
VPVSHLGPGQNEAVGKIVAIGDRELVASYPGVVIGAGITAAAACTQIMALNWVATTAGVPVSHCVFVVLWLGAIIYCGTVAGSITLNGTVPPLAAKPPPEDGNKTAMDGATAEPRASLNARRSRLLP